MNIFKDIKIAVAGTGYVGLSIATLLSQHHQVTAVDVTEEMLRHAEENAEAYGAQVRFLAYDGKHLPLESESFDLVVSRNVLWNMEDPEGALKEWKRVLRPGGRMVYLDANWYLYLFDKEKIIIDEKDIRRILSGRIVASLSLEIHLLIVNFRSVLLSLIDKREPWTDKDFRMTYSRLMQGIDDMGSLSYRDGYSLREVRGKDKVRVDVQMETLLTQYESWKNLNSLVSAVMLYGEMERISPFEKYPSFFSFLVLSGELLRGNILPPSFALGDKAEFDASYFIALKRGNYRDFTSFIESRVIRSYKLNV